MTFRRWFHDGLGYNGMRPGVREYLFRDYIREEDMPGYSKEDGNILKPFGAAVKAGRDGLGWRKRQVYIERMLEEWNKDAEM